MSERSPHAPPVRNARGARGGRSSLAGRHGVTDYAVDVRQKVRLGGRWQQIQVLAARVGLPSLIVLHGGPGFASGRAFLDRHGALAEHFTVVTWDQRGAGASFFGAGCERLTLDGLVEDAAELVGYVGAHNPHAPVYVLGLSWGSELGIRLVQRHPSGIAGYVGSGQAVDGVAGERLSWQWAADQAANALASPAASPAVRRRARRDRVMLDIVGPPVMAQYRPVLAGLGIQRRVLGRYAAAAVAAAGDEAARRAAPTGAMPVAPGAAAPSSQGPGAPAPARNGTHAGQPEPGTPDGDPSGQAPRRRRRWPVPLAERVGGPAGVVRSLAELWPTATVYDFRTQAPVLGVPVWILQGEHDHTTPSELVREYAAILEAPSLTVSWFAQSGHSPGRDEPEAFRSALIEGLLGAEPQPSTHDDSTDAGDVR